MALFCRRLDFIILENITSFHAGILRLMVRQMLSYTEYMNSLLIHKLFTGGGESKGLLAQSVAERSEWDG